MRSIIFLTVLALAALAGWLIARWCAGRRKPAVKLQIHREPDDGGGWERIVLDEASGAYRRVPVDESRKRKPWVPRRGGSWVRW